MKAEKQLMGWNKNKARDYETQEGRVDHIWGDWQQHWGLLQNQVPKPSIRCRIMKIFGDIGGEVMWKLFSWDKGYGGTKMY